MKKSATAFPQSKIKEIVLTDPDVKDISKPAVEVLKNAAEIFAAQFFQKCFEEAHKSKRITSKINDFISAVNKDEALSQMLGQFIVNPKDLKKNEDEEDDDIENAVKEIDNSNNNSDDNSENENENENKDEEDENESKDDENENKDDDSDSEIYIKEIERMNEDSDESDENNEYDNGHDENEEKGESKKYEDDQGEPEEDIIKPLKRQSSSDSSINTESDLSDEPNDQDLDVDDD